MLPLGTPRFPEFGEELAEGLRRGLAGAFRLAAGAQPVAFTGDFPTLASLRVNLTGAVMNEGPPPARAASEDTHPPICVRAFTFEASPLQIAPGAELTLRVEAEGIRFSCGRDGLGRAMLVFAGAERGTVHLRADARSADALALMVFRPRLSAQGFDLAQLHVDFESHGPRTLEARVSATAAKGFVSGAVEISGRVDFDDLGRARLTGLVCKGRGFVGTVAEGLVRRALTPHEGRVITLDRLGLGPLRLSDVTVGVDAGTVRLDGAFVGAAD